MSSPKISVVVPCFNHGEYLDEAIDSVFAQSLQSFEIVIVDDGSTELATRELLGSYRRPRTRVLRTANRGLPAARNLGIRSTSAPYVCALDADDRLAPSWFEKALEVLDSDPSVSFVSHWFETFGDERWRWTPERCDLPALLDRNTVNGAAVARRADLEAVGLYDESWRDGCEDWDLWVTLVERGFRGVILPAVHFHYRRRADSMSRAMNRPTRQLELFRRLITKHSESYRRHLLDLLLRRETNLCDLLGELDDLEREHHGWWRPELERRRAEVATLRRRVEALRQRQAEAAERRRLEADLEGHRQALAATEADLEGHRQALANAEADLEGHRQALANAEAELASWRQSQAEGEAACRRLGAELAELDGVRAQQDAARRHIEADLEGHRRALADAEAELAAVRQSWSWRLSAPLRRLGGRRR